MNYPHPPNGAPGEGVCPPLIFFIFDFSKELIFIFLFFLWFIKFKVYFFRFFFEKNFADLSILYIYILYYFFLYYIFEYTLYTLYRVYIESIYREYMLETGVAWGRVGGCARVDILYIYGLFFWFRRDIFVVFVFFGLGSFAC